MRPNLSHDEQFSYYTAHHWAVATSMSTYSIILLIDEQFSYYTAHHWAVATSMSTYSGILATNFLWGVTRKRVWWLHDPRFFSPQTRMYQMPLPHSCGIMLLWKQYETIQGLSCGIMQTLMAASLPTLLRHHCRLDSLSHRMTCGVIAVLIFIVASEAGHFHKKSARCQLYCCLQQLRLPYHLISL
jgi:hypothetical protein